ncbi:MAG: hypothetical protein OEZ04_02175 [Nitrospinota bacterium]|nr:hypothetical protein [Nitrospinota bacterium]
MTKEKIKVLGLVSGGLDSHLATRIMKKLGYDITALNFTSPFCNCTRKDHGCKNEAARLAEELGIKVQVEFMGQEYIDLVRNPKHGYGKNMNPCVDCRIMIFRRAKVVMENIGAAFIFTGEVVGQRPMSQKAVRMALIDKEAGLSGMVVRPLSAQILPPTIPEQNGMVDREEMLAIQGRSRKDQIRIMRDEYEVTENLCSSGGCSLTDPQFAHRMRDLLDNNSDASVKDARFLRVGRHFRVSPGIKVIVGRDESENDRLEKMAGENDFLFMPEEVRGPLSVVKGAFGKEDLDPICKAVARYCPGEDDRTVKIKYKMKSGTMEWRHTASPATEAELASWRV